MAIEYIDRVPRIQPELPFGEVKIPNPPQDESGRGQDIISLLLPLVTVLGFVFVSSSSGNALFAVPMAATMLHFRRRGTLPSARGKGS